MLKTVKVVLLDCQKEFSGQDAQIRALDEYNQIQLSGYVPVTMTEFFQHSGSMEGLEGLVSQKVSARLHNSTE